MDAEDSVSGPLGGSSGNRNTMTGSLAIPNSMLKPMPARHSMYRLIGRVVTEASFHEHVLDAILSKLPATGESKKTDGQVKIIPPSIRYLEIKKRLAALGFNKFNKKIDEAQDQSIIPILRRNRFIHDTWYADSPKDTAHQFAKVSLERTPLEKTEIEWKPVDKPYVVALIKDLRKCSKRAMALLRRIENLPLDPID